ncbi:hypothetical protein [Cystobacter fuscus]|uniref:hypothetical protein n=1 Tax=Cystobacter fuscus TaxID=43 RepID=UPI002B29897E|nr:hypothetical protein F0U63_02045 [Cystobacter fuscus]
MVAVTREPADVVVEIMRKYLRNGPTGCAFAADYAKAADAIQWGVWSGTSLSVLSPSVPLHEDLAAFFTGAARMQRPGIAVFPEIRTAEDIVELLVGLAGKSGWSLSREEWKRYPRGDELAGLWWQTPAGQRTSVMGFAPLGSMPVTRRAPFVAVAAWTGPQLNPQKTKKMKVPGPSNEVGFVDMKLIHPDTHDSMWDSTSEKVRELKALTKEGAARPTVAFCLPASCAPHLAKHYQVAAT